MIGSDDEFRARLLEMFREEADGYLEVITEGLIALEKNGLAPDLVEQVYRTVHSLKGASRAVNLREIESICQNIETVFALVKRGEYTPDVDDFDLFHRTISVIKSLLDGERPDLSPAEINGALRAIPGGRETARSAPTEKLRSRPDQVPGERDTPGTPVNHNGSWQRTDRSTVRIAAHRLDQLTAGADNLLTARLFIKQRIHELEEMMTRFSLWQRNHSQTLNDMQVIRRTTFGEGGETIPLDLVLPLQRAVKFLEYNREFVTNLQHDLATHLRFMENDRSALEASTSEISDLIHDAVLLPASTILTPFSAFVREFSRTSGKLVNLTIEGGEIEVDRRILDALKNPIMHLIRNSIDHGIESPEIRRAREKPDIGTVQIRVFSRSGSRVGIEVSDDGAGIDSCAIRKTAVETGVISADEDARLTDSEAIWLIFHSGMTTSRIVTDLSGRGLGLAIVEDAVSRLGGKVTITSTPGSGTAITLTVPVSMATLRGLLVRSERQVYALPMQQVKQVLRVHPDTLTISRNRPAIHLSGEIIEVIRLTDALDIPPSGPVVKEDRPKPIVIIAYGAGQIACMVDEIIQVQEIVVRPLGSQLRSVRRIDGAVILGDGHLALVLDPLELIQDALQAEREISMPRLPPEMQPRILVVEDSVTSRALLQAILEGAGYRVETAVNGVDAFAKLKQHAFDIVVSDVDMPRMNGFALTEKIRAAGEQFARLQVMLVTSLDSPEDRERGRSAGADAYIVKKNFEAEEFLRIIQHLTRRPERERKER
ncbi:MAG: response regulator [Methanomicrobiales archaeon]|nr:response regulator [Methanomicrobiales archaeon]